MKARIARHPGFARLLATLVVTGAFVLLFHSWFQTTPALHEPFVPPAQAASGIRGYPLQAGQSAVFIPAAAHATGAAGTNWRSDVEIHNPGSSQAAYTIALLKRDNDNSSPTTKSFTLNPGLSVRYSDILSSMFGFSGAAALKISVTSGSILASSRTYNLMVAGNPLNLPAGATFGQFVPALAATDAVASTEQARLIQLAHSRTSSGFRTNIGYVNTTSTTLTMTTDLYTASGTKLGTYNDSLPPFGYKQVDKIFEKVTSQDVTDGYAIVRTTTTGGTFFAYASVIDNPTGDPTFIPAQKTSSSTPPSPTPTPSPTPGTRPLGTVETANDTMSLLGLAGTSGKPTLEQVVKDLQTDGIEAVLNDVVSQKPSIASRVPNGIKINYGTGYRTLQGDVLTGTVTGTYSNFSATSTKVTGNYSLTFTNFTKNGGYATIQNVTGSANLNVSGTGKVSGDITINGSGTSPVGTTTVSGTVRVDTAVCLKYPVSGTVTVRRGTETKTITFTSSCNGGYQFSGVGLEYAYFELRPLKCDGSAYTGYGVKIGLAAESGTVVVDPNCLYNTGLRDHRVSGTMSPTEVTLNFSSWVGNHLFQGVFRGTASNGGYFLGSATYTVKAYDGSTVICSSSPYTAFSSPNMEVWINRLPYSFCR